MKSELTSKERVLRTVRRQPADRVPCAFSGLCHGSGAFLDRVFKDPFEEADYFLSLGIDTAINIGGGQGVSSKGIEINHRTETPADIPVWTKEITTGAGKLRQSVRKNVEYSYESIPLFSDQHVPPWRSLKYLIDSPGELEAFRLLMKIPEPDEVPGEYDWAKIAGEYCRKNGVLLSASLQGIGDPLLWLSGVENVLFAAADNPGFLHEYINILSDWNISHLNRHLENGAEYILRRGWYESTDFWSPKLFREFLLEPLKREVKTAHEAGAVYAYIMNSGVNGLINELRESGIDVLTNAEPEKNDLIRIRREAGGMALCTGVNNYHVIEKGSEEEVEAAVVWAMENLSPGGGFILSPSDTVDFAGMAGAGGFEKRRNTGIIMRNFRKMMETWERMA